MKALLALRKVPTAFMKGKMGKLAKKTPINMAIK
jgi:hypothetical protein